MKRLELTLPTLAENLALDEALLEESESTGDDSGWLRLWEYGRQAVVLGRSSIAAIEVEVEDCRTAGIELGRRCSGGATVLIGPGCLMYSLVLPHATTGGLDVDRMHCQVLGTMQHGLQRLQPGVSCAGTSDLAIGGRKFSGNSLRVKRSHFLYHGTVLYDLSPRDVARFLRHAPRQPAYRAGRDHASFVDNFPARREELAQAIVDAWNAHDVSSDWPRSRTAQLVADRYAHHAWTFAR